MANIPPSLIAHGATPKTVLIRGRGPSLAGAGITMPLPNPVLQVLNGTTVIASNDNWPSAANVGAISATGLQPSNNAEAAVLVRLNPGRTPCVPARVRSGDPSHAHRGVLLVTHVGMPRSAAPC